MIKEKDTSMKKIENWINNDFVYIEESTSDKNEDNQNYDKILKMNYFLYFIVLYLYL